MAPPRVSIPRIRNVRLKENPVGDMLIPMGPGQPVWTPRRYDRFADEGYIQNVIAHRCVRLYASSIAGLSLFVQVGEDQVDSHPLLDLLRQPNPADPGPQFLEEVVSHRAIAGNAYIYAVRPSARRPPVELWPLRPDRTKIVPGDTGLPMAFEYDAYGQTRRFPVDPLTGRGDILHLKGFHPLDDWYGLSPIEPAARSIDQDNAATAHNASLLQNGARPSGALVMRESISPEQRMAAEATMRNWYQNGARAGLPMVLGGPWEWLSLNQSLQEMEFSAGLDHNARRICAAFNIPHVLVVPGESTYNNRREAREELYEHAILPEADMILASLNGWLAPMFGPNVQIRYDPDLIPALAGKRELIRSGIRQDWRDDLITHGEAREGLGYGVDDDKADQYRSELVGLGLGMPGDPGDEPPADDEADGEDQGQDKSRKGRPVTKADPDDVAGAIDDSEMIDLLIPEIRQTIHGFGQFEIDRLGIGVRFDLFNPRVVEFLQTFGAERITGQVTETTKRQIGKTLAEARAAGEGQFQQIKRIQAVFDQAAGPRARLIAQTESTRASSFGSLEAMTQVGVELKRWLCVDGGSRVSGFGISHVARRPYSGPLVELATADGRVVTVTPEHRVLTSAGWVEAGAVCPGDYLVGYDLGVEGGGPRPGEVPNVDDVPPTIAEVFSALHEAATSGGAMGAAVNLERHGVHGEVEVVALNGDLLAHLQPACPQSVRKVLLELSDLRLGALLGEGALPHDGIRDRDADTLGRDAAIDFAEPLDLAGPRDPRAGSRSEVAQGNALFLEHASDGEGGASVVEGDQQSAFAGGVPLRYDRCVGIKVFQSSGHVYDFSTENHWMVADELVVHNSTRDSRTRGSNPSDKADHVGLDLQVRRVGENFKDPRNGHEFQHPGASAHAEDVCDCRCIAIAYDPDEDKGLDAATIETKAGEVWKAFDGQRLPYTRQIEGTVRHAFQLQYQAVLRRLLKVTS